MSAISGAAGGTIPHTRVAMTTPFATSSATFVDIAGASRDIVLPVAAPVTATAGVQWSGANSCEAEFRLVIAGVAGDSTESDAIGANDYSHVSIIFGTDEPVPAGTYAVKVQARKVSGAGDITVAHVDMTAMGMVAVGA